MMFTKTELEELDRVSNTYAKARAFIKNRVEKPSEEGESTSGEAYQDLDTVLMAALADFLQGTYEELIAARDLLKQSESIGRGNFAWTLLSAQVLLYLGQTAEALELAKAAHEAKPANREAALTYAILLGGARRWKDALKTIDGVLPKDVDPRRLKVTFPAAGTTRREEVRVNLAPSALGEGESEAEATTLDILRLSRYQDPLLRDTETHRLKRLFDARDLIRKRANLAALANPYVYPDDILAMQGSTVDVFAAANFVRLSEMLVERTAAEAKILRTLKATRPVANENRTLWVSTSSLCEHPVKIEFAMPRGGIALLDPELVRSLARRIKLNRIDRVVIDGDEYAQLVGEDSYFMTLKSNLKPSAAESLLTGDEDPLAPARKADPARLRNPNNTKAWLAYIASCLAAGDYSAVISAMNEIPEQLTPYLFNEYVRAMLASEDPEIETIRHTVRAIKVLEGMALSANRSPFWTYYMALALHKDGHAYLAAKTFFTAASEDRTSKSLLHAAQANEEVETGLVLAPFALRAKSVWEQLSGFDKIIRESIEEEDDFDTMRSLVLNILSCVGRLWETEFAYEDKVCVLRLDPCGIESTYLAMREFAGRMPLEMHKGWRVEISEPSLADLMKTEVPKKIPVLTGSLNLEDVRAWPRRIDKDRWEVDLWSESLEGLARLSNEMASVTGGVGGLLDIAVRDILNGTLGAPVALRSIDTRWAVRKGPAGEPGLTLTELRKFFYEAVPEMRDATLADLTEERLACTFEANENPDAPVFEDIYAGKISCPEIVRPILEKKSNLDLTNLLASGATVGVFVFDVRPVANDTRAKKDARRRTVLKTLRERIEADIGEAAEIATFFGANRVYAVYALWFSARTIFEAKVFFGEKRNLLFSGFMSPFKDTNIRSYASVWGNDPVSDPRDEANRRLLKNARTDEDEYFYSVVDDMESKEFFMGYGDDDFEFDPDDDEDFDEDDADDEDESPVGKDEA